MSLRISRILHAGYLFETEIKGQTTRILFDPIFENPFSRNCFAFPEVTFNEDEIRKLDISGIFISHVHDDHCSLESLNLLDRSTPIYIYCLAGKTLSVIKELGFAQVNALKTNETVNLGAFEIIVRRALDEDIDSILHIKSQGLNILNLVDSWIDYETLDLLCNETWDLILWPFQTMREVEVLSPSRAGKANRELPPEWLEQLSLLRPKFLVPSSCQFIHEEWSWYNKALFPISYRHFEHQMAKILPETKVVRLNPSDTRLLSDSNFATLDPLTWVDIVGDPTVDYKFDENLKPPTTSEISKHFKALSTQQTDLVYQYCRLNLPLIFETLEPLQEKYFENPRNWQLALYDHQGHAKNFYYLIHRNQIGFVEESDVAVAAKFSLGWKTEVSIAKLFAALKLGETLTSMYVRINDQIFECEVEKALQDIDPLNDPLIRCIFNSDLASYHEIQIQNIRQSLNLN